LDNLVINVLEIVAFLDIIAAPTSSVLPGGASGWGRG